MSWSWRTTMPGSCLQGEFNTRDEAIADAAENVPGRTVLVGEISDLVPVDYADAAVDIDWVMQAMDEAAEMDTDDPVFDVDGEGEKALKELMRQWVEKHVTANITRVTRDEEEVDVG